MHVYIRQPDSHHLLHIFFDSIRPQKVLDHMYIQACPIGCSIDLLAANLVHPMVTKLAHPSITSGVSGFRMHPGRCFSFLRTICWDAQPDHLVDVLRQLVRADIAVRDWSVLYCNLV